MSHIGANLSSSLQVPPRINMGDREMRNACHTISSDLQVRANRSPEDKLYQ